MRRLFLSAIALVLGLFTVTAGLAFAIVPSVQQDTWHYAGDNDPSNFHDAELWEEGVSNTNCDISSELPCQITDNSIPDRDALQGILDANPGSQIYDVAGRKASSP